MKMKTTILAPPRIEMMPLIDIVFLLLVFFIFAMLSMAVHRGQTVDLPESSSSPVDVKKALSITIRASGDQTLLFIDEKAVSLDQLGALLERKKLAEYNDEDCEVQIFADKTIAYQKLFNVLDQVKLAKFSRISLQANLEKTDHDSYNKSIAGGNF